jgi:hypothetical protein
MIQRDRELVVRDDIVESFLPPTVVGGRSEKLGVYLIISRSVSSFLFSLFRPHISFTSDPLGDTRT